MLILRLYHKKHYRDHKGDAIERVHREFVKGPLKVQSTTMNEFVCGEFGHRPLIYESYIRIVKCC